ncbi:50S ribosomal protein L29 [Coxiella endosymbiont of Amblyomma sculptum]|uniref:50S ribosomal protein L29 n=1 Tax=Coxiella endosymbiont of Amblyomma sculptum TaxID=2487929 RepID=UPI00132E977E|nr:50S ribosomal protein L29 [Coxiella endosymbiont of Amblyomma sculptum]QHG92699.1 50S ribosomal protein L29 [Coxiella endosymbiont of Amblyomma sculptum]
MKTERFCEKSESELKKELVSLLKEQFSFRMQMGVREKTVRPHLCKRIRRSVARTKTFLREKRGRGGG